MKQKKNLFLSFHFIVSTMMSSGYLLFIDCIISMLKKQLYFHMNQLIQFT